MTRKLAAAFRAAGVCLALATAIGTPATALAAEAEAVNLRGSIVKFSGGTLDVMTRDGETVGVALAAGWMVVGVASADIADIKPGDYVGIASLPMADGSDGALEVLIFPAAMKGVHEGRFGWDLQPNSTMTNATVAEVVKQVDGQILTVAYQGYEKQIALHDGTPVVTIAPASEADLKPGAAVFISARQAADGTTSAGRVVVGTNGVIPPM